MPFVIGFLGGLAVVALMATGAALGWKAHALFARHTAPKAQSPEAEDLEKMKATQQAFRELSNYSMETAYGMKDNSIGGDS